MEKILVYCEYPVSGCLRCLQGSNNDCGVCAEGAPVGYGYLYTLKRTDKGLSVSDFIGIVSNFVCGAIVESLTRKRLRRLTLTEGMNAESLSVIFSKRLAEYLEMTGNRRKIIKIVESLLIADGLLAETNVVNINGIMSFRLRELLPDLNAFFDLAFYEHTVKSQYDDFISLAACYVEQEPPKEAAVHIVFEHDGRSFALYDDRRNDITQRALKNYRNDATFSEENINDFLISSLLYLLPQTVVIHCGEKKGGRITETIEAIFKEKVVKCRLCESGLCMPSEIRDC